MGDYQNAKDLYNQIELNSEEKEEYKSITAIIETFINKENSSKIIDELIANSPEDEYLRFAILSDDVKVIKSAPGIGAKTAQRLIIELFQMKKK